MNQFIDKLNNSIISNPNFIISTENLFKLYIEFIIGNEISINKSAVKKLISAIQYFYRSNDEKIKSEGAILLAMLLDVAGKDFDDLIPIAKSIFINIGDFPNISLLEKKYPEIKMEFGFYTNAKFEFKTELNTVKTLDFPLTDYQRLLWRNLTAKDDVVTIAPTSAGKTHIILNYLVQKIIESKGAFAIIVVPTRALIAEVANKLYQIAQKYDGENDIEICTIPRDKDFNKKTMFVMTQERLYELLQAGDLSFNYLFIDEAHNISDKSRGVLLHLTLEKLFEDSYPQTIISMPSEEYQNAFSSIFKGMEFRKEITRHSPVAKIILNVKLVSKNIEIARHDTDYKVKIPKKFTGRKLSDIVLRLGKGESNIIYRSKTNYCEDVAHDIASSIFDFETTPALEEAADYIEKFVHQDFTLASNLRKGVAFHYGPLPSSVRVMIETLVKDGDVKYIACTSTLAEGVNLPAKNLFLQNPIQPITGLPSERIEDVKISNITGRAGRMVEHFSGNIFLIEPEDWTFKDYFDEKDNNESRIPSYYKTLNEDTALVMNAIEGNYPHTKSDQYLYYTIANKLIKEFSNDNLDNTIGSSDLKLSIEQKNSLLNKIELAHNALKIAPFILEANPTIGYIQQNKLFEFINTQLDFKDWVIPHPKSKELHDTLLRISYKLNEFGVYVHSEEYSIDYIILIASKWISGKSLKDIISEQIAWDDKHSDNCSPNSSVRRVIKVINNDIGFRLRNAISCYHLLLTNAMTVKGINKVSVKIHTYLEIGACDDRMISLINMGLSRESAKEIDDKIDSILNIDSISDLASLLIMKKLDNVHPITKKEIISLIS